MRSDISGFYKLAVEERLRMIKEAAKLSNEEAEILRKTGALELKIADVMIENVIGTQELPLGIAMNFKINGTDYLIPMSIEEPSVVAGASNAAKLCRPEGFIAEGGEPLMIGQIQVVGTKDSQAVKKILEAKEELLAIAEESNPGLRSHGGGAGDIEAYEIDSIRGKMIIVNLTANVSDAMGANIINTMCEFIGPKIEELSGGKARLKIVTNLATKRLAKARAVWKKDDIGSDAIEGVLDAYAFALADHYRCSTHNKGIMNGIDAVALATSQDFRALEAAAHSYAAIGGRYKPLTKYYKNENGDLAGEIELPVPAGIVGGATKTSPVAKIALKILGVSSSKEFAQVLAAVGLAQNFAALKALSTEGIQAGHMKLHAKNLSIAAGAQEREIEQVSGQMINEKNISTERAKEILDKMRTR